MMRFWDLALMSWLFQILLNFLWVPLTAYTHHLGLSVGFTGTVFAVNVGARFFPNLLVTQIGASSEFVMMTATFLGNVVSYMWPAEAWALYVLAFGTAMGFARPCVTLHIQATCGKDLDSLTFASKRCGAARSCADICSFILPASVYQCFGWEGVTIFGGSIALAYLLLALRRRLLSRVVSARDRAARQSSEQQSPPEREKGPIQWIDWIISAAFVSTELQINLFNTSMTTALMREYEVPPAFVGTLLGLGAFFTFCCLIVLPSLSSSTWQKPNLLITYFGMFAAWTLMLGAVILFPVQPFVSSAYLFQVMANLSQIDLLESLTGALDLESSTKVLGISEMFGCGFAMVGSYLGTALLAFGTPYPFAVCTLWSFLSWSVLLFSMGLRRYENSQFRKKTDAADPQGKSWAHRSIVGLRYIFMVEGEKSRSYLTDECMFRQSLSDPLLFT